MWFHHKRTVKICSRIRWVKAHCGRKQARLNVISRRLPFRVDETESNFGERVLPAILKLTSVWTAGRLDCHRPPIDTVQALNQDFRAVTILPLKSPQ